MEIAIGPLHTALSGMEIGAPFVFERITLFPLSLGTPGIEFLTLEEAVSTKQVKITEVDEAGMVNELRVKSKAAKPILMVDGDLLVGAKQNRILNASLLVAPGEELIAPVSCVESGRWSRKSVTFAKQEAHLFSKARAQVMQDVNRDPAERKRSDQQRVWRTIDGKMAELNAENATRDLSLLFESQRPKLEHLRESLAPREGQWGAAVFIDAGFAGLDLFGHPGVFAKKWPALLNGYGLDALGDVPVREPADLAKLQALLARLNKVPVRVQASSAGCQELRFSTSEFTGCCLMQEKALVHLSAFPVAEGD